MNGNLRGIGELVHESPPHAPPPAEVLRKVRERIPIVDDVLVEARRAEAALAAAGARVNMSVVDPVVLPWDFTLEFFSTAVPDATSPFVGTNRKPPSCKLGMCAHHPTPDAAPPHRIAASNRKSPR